MVMRSSDPEFHWAPPTGLVLDGHEQELASCSRHAGEHDPRARLTRLRGADEERPRALDKAGLRGEARVLLGGQNGVVLLLDDADVGDEAGVVSERAPTGARRHAGRR